MGPNLVILASHKIHLTLEKGPIHAIPTCHKVHFTLERGPIHAIPTYQIKPIVEKKPIYAIHAYQMQPTLEKGAHQCNTYISNATYIGKKDSSIQYLHIKCNLH